jgi:hypothetical protein
MRTGETKELDFGRLVILIRVNVDLVLAVLFPEESESINRELAAFL